MFAIKTSGLLNIDPWENSEPMSLQICKSSKRQSKADLVMSNPI